ncbi:hypothetical protein IW261DRAFT_628939 [Armillaria novae-zelandiae]|uniref:F-box domain-containing protein n=1 Tax=Armillaria novae-zelandiae TaxID=153914 RepID=A0AA39PNL8_9AGAR|nr:hypothetical protein IW261DRAFT_628939 [Armillaria novae-zelandiae]
MEKKSKANLKQNAVSKALKFMSWGSKNRRATRSTAISRINERLPNELLAYIFATTIIGLLPKERRSFLALVCSVCGHWRDVAIETSELWTTIYIHSPKDIPSVKLFLERSKAQLLDVDIQVTFGLERWFGLNPWEASDGHHRGLRVVGLTSDHLWRTRTLSLCLDDANDAERISALYRPLSAPHLISLFIYIEQESQSATILLDSICSIRSRRTECSPSNTILISSLTRLELASLCPEYEDMRRIFACSRSLETLILPKFGCIPWGTWQGKNKSIITAPSSLRSLIVHINSSHEIEHVLTVGPFDGYCVLPAIRFPNLEYLEVLGDDSSYNVDFGGHFKDLPKLKTLRLKQCSVSPADAQFFCSLKLLDRLELVDNLEDVAWSDGRSQNVSFPFPRLSSILISEKGRGSYDMSQWARLARLAVNDYGCTQFSIEVTTQLYGTMVQHFGPQDEHIRVEVNDHSSGLL